MDTVRDTAPDSLRLDFHLARLELAEARLARSRKDTPGARAWVTRCQVQLDGILDMMLATRSPS